MDNQVIRVVNTLCEDVGSPRALAVKLLANAGEWAQLQELRCRPRDFDDGETYWKDNLVTDLLRKCDLPTTVDREEAAVQSFLLCEEQNCATNVRLSRYLPETLFFEDIRDVAVHDFICRWRKEVSLTLGNLPDHLTPRFSSGATFADTGFLITTPDKMSSTPTIYSETRCLLPQWVATSWFRSLAGYQPQRSDPRTVRGNIFFTVPKDGTKFRGCCKEASIPVSYQLDVGRLMKTKLLSIGINLREGQSIHRALARKASVDGLDSTVDMSNASDTLCRVLPKLVLRRDWWELLDSLRAKMTRVKGKWHRLEKFSSMGNGFTFELETLIFATLARTVIRDEGGDPDKVKCYGDDLIVPAEHTRSVLAALRLFGFTPNERKTFVEGPFRESCGGDYWSGTPVRAHFIENLPNEPQQWISLANGLRRVANANGYGGPRWAIVHRAWLRALDPIPSDIRRCRGPESLGDVVIHDLPEFWGIAVPPKVSRSVKVVVGGVKVKLLIDDGDTTTWDQKWVHAYLPVPSVLPWHHWLPSVQLASCTLGLPSTGITPRGGVSGYRIGVVPCGITSSWLPRPGRVDSTRESRAGFDLPVRGYQDQAHPVS